MKELNEIKTIDVILIIAGTLTGSVLATLVIGLFTNYTFADLLVIASGGGLIAISARFLSISKTHNITPKNKQQ
jgi:hypothetical protein